MSHISHRVSRLEEAAGVRDTPRHVVRIIAEPNETEDAAVERYRAGNPGVPDYTLFIVRILVSPQHREAKP